MLRGKEEAHALTWMGQKKTLQTPRNKKEEQANHQKPSEKCTNMTSVNGIYILQHRLPALSAAFLQSIAFALTIYAGNTCQFLKVKYDDPHSPLDGDNVIADEKGDQSPSHSTTFGDNHDIGIFCNSERFPDEDDAMWNISRAFLVSSYVLLGLGTLLAWGLSTFVRPTPQKWKTLSVLSILTACIETPVFLFSTVEPCQSYEGQTCTVGKGFFMHLWSVVALIFLTVFTQVHDCPQWWDVTMGWKIDKKRDKFGEIGYDLRPYDNIDDNGPDLLDSKIYDECKIAVRRDSFLSRLFAFTTSMRYGTNIKHTAIIEEMDENDEENGCSSYNSNERINSMSPLALVKKSYDIERLMLQMTPDGKEVGDDRQSQYSFDLNIDDHIDSPTQSCSDLLPLKGSDDVFMKGLDFSNIPVQERRDMDKSFPRQISLVIPASSDQLDRPQEVPAKTENAESFYSAHGNLSDNTNITCLEDNYIEKQNLPILDLSEKINNNAIQFSPARRAAIGQPIERQENLIVSESQEEASKLLKRPKQEERNEVIIGGDQVPQELNVQTKLCGSMEGTIPYQHNTVCTVSTDEGKADDCESLSLLQQEERNEVPFEVDQKPQEIDLQAKHDGSAEGTIPCPLQHAAECSIKTNEAKEEFSNVDKSDVLKRVDERPQELNMEEKHDESTEDEDLSIIQLAGTEVIRSPLELAVLTGLNEAAKSNTNMDDEPEPIYYSSDDHSISSSLSNSTGSSSKLSCRKEIELLLHETKKKCDKNKPRRSHKRRKRGRRKSTQSICSKVSLLSMTIDEETDLDIENEDKSASLSGSNYETTDEILTIGAHSNQQGPNVISPMNGFSSHYSLHSSDENYNTEYSRSSYYSSDSTGYCTGNSSYSCNGDGIMHSTCKSTSALPIISPTSHDVNGEYKSERIASFPSDIFLDNVYVSDNDYDPNSCLSSVSTRARSARKKRLKRSHRHLAKRGEPDVLKKEDIITFHAIVQSYASDEASL